MFLLRRMLTPPERLLSSLSASPLSLSRLCGFFVSLMQPRHGIVIVINFHFYL